MLFKFIFIQLALMLSVNATSGLDKKLQSYIQKFQLKSVEKPSGLNNVKFLLGEKLFFEKEISGNRNISCSTCHDSNLGSGDSLPLPIGEGGEGIGPYRIAHSSRQVIARNSPALYNLGHDEMGSLFWDGRVQYKKNWDVYTTPSDVLNGDYPERWDISEALGSALAAQALFPILSNDEMRGDRGSNDIADANSDEEAWAIVMKRLLNIEEYRALFKKVYPNAKEINIGHFGNAVAHFEEHRFAVFDTPWDEYLRGEESSLSNSAKRGALVFFEGGLCIRCHNGSLLGGVAFEGVAAPQVGPGKDIKHNDEGRFLITKNEADRYHFRVPPLRNISLTAPYFHSGVYKTLSDVIEHYRSGVRGIDNYKSDWLDDYFKVNYPEKLFVETNRYMIFKKKENAHPVITGEIIHMNESQKKDLLFFLTNSLTGSLRD